jgi:hypothetical protein
MGRTAGRRGLPSPSGPFTSHATKHSATGWPGRGIIRAASGRAASRVSARSYQGVARAGRPRSGSPWRPLRPPDDRGRPDLTARHRAPRADVSMPETLETRLRLGLKQRHHPGPELPAPIVHVPVGPPDDPGIRPEPEPSQHDFRRLRHRRLGPDHDVIDRVGRPSTVEAAWTSWGLDAPGSLSTRPPAQAMDKTSAGLPSSLGPDKPPQAPRVRGSWMTDGVPRTHTTPRGEAGRPGRSTPEASGRASHARPGVRVVRFD